MVFHLSSHDGVRYPFTLEVSNQTSELADAHPFEMGSLPFDLGRGLFPNRRDYYLNASISRTFEHKKGKAPVTCYQSVLHKIGDGARAVGCEGWKSQPAFPSPH